MILYNLYKKKKRKATKRSFSIFIQMDKILIKRTFTYFLKLNFPPAFL